MTFCHFAFTANLVTTGDFVDQAVPNRPIHATWPKRCWPHCRDENHPSFERSQRVWEQRMNRFTDVKSMNLQDRRFEFRDFHGSFALDFEIRKWQTLEQTSDGKQGNSFKGLAEAADLLEADDGTVRTVVDVGAKLGFQFHHGCSAAAAQPGHCHRSEPCAVSGVAVEHSGQQCH